MINDESSANKHIISVIAANNPGVLARIAGLFARRGYNIDSITVGVFTFKIAGGAAEKPEKKFARITIIANGDNESQSLQHRGIEQITKQLNKLIEVFRVKEIPYSEAVWRELVLVKLSAPDKAVRDEVLTLTEDSGITVAGESGTTITLQYIENDENDILLRRITDAGFDILEIVRTGAVAMQKGGDYLTPYKNLPAQ